MCAPTETPIGEIGHRRDCHRAAAFSVAWVEQQLRWSGSPGDGLRHRSWRRSV